MKTLTDQEFELFRVYIKKRFGINLSDEKKSLIYSRLRSLVEKHNLATFKDYYEMLQKDKDTGITLEFINKITTNHTFFMREKEHFDYLSRVVFPALEQRHQGTKDIRLWCAACSSGEEAYTLQILLQEYFANKGNWNTEMLATDISNNVLTKAYRGIYSNEAIKELPETWVKKYFKKHDDHHMEAVDTLKKNITFTRFNFIEDKFSFKKPFQVIFCRNAMIYFDAQTRSTLVNQFYNVTEKDGYLFIGQSESLGYADTKYEYAMPAVYKRPH